MRFSPRCLLTVFPAACAVALSGVTPAAFAADPPPAVKPAPPADTKATPIRFTLQLVRIDEATAAVNPGTPVTPTQRTVASPILTTLDDSTATISVASDDLSYTLSLSPNIAANGKILTLWNIRLSGKSLPGATAVTATGATKVEGGKPAVLAEISLTDPASGHRATFVLQGTTLTGDAAINTAPAPMPVAAPPAAIVP